jgi:hypothetical protein
MDTDETKSFDSSQTPSLDETSSKTPKTLGVMGVSPLPKVSDNNMDKPQRGLIGGLILPMKWMIIIGLPAFFLIAGSIGLFNFARGAVDGLTAKKIPTDQINSNITKTNNSVKTSDSKNSCTKDLASRMAQSKVTSKQVDKIFYQTYPDRQSKPLADTPTESSLRQQWCSIADELIVKKQAK